MTRSILIFFGLVLPLSLVQAREPRPASQIAIPLADGKKITLQQYKGKVVLLVIFSTTCEDCIGALQFANIIQKDFGPKGFQAIGAAGDDNAQYQVGGIVDRFKLTFPVGYVTKDQIIGIADLEKGQRPFVPMFIFIDKTGTVRFQYESNHPFFKTVDGSTRSMIQNLLQGK
jgi:peroxiredoxin